MRPWAAEACNHPIVMPSGRVFVNPPTRIVAVDRDRHQCAGLCHRADSEWHEEARSRIESLAHGRVSWGLPWPCLHEFLAIVTHPGIYDPPSTMDVAIDQVDAWLEFPVAQLLTETETHWNVLKDALRLVSLQASVNVKRSRRRGTS